MHSKLVVILLAIAVVSAQNGSPGAPGSDDSDGLPGAPGGAVPTVKIRMGEAAVADDDSDGDAGSPGLPGSSGGDGSPGLPGSSGGVGGAGSSGLPGSSGGVGGAGLPGLPGSSGSGGYGGAGAPGLPGSSGGVGLAGAPGLSGSSGGAGLAGAPGLPGSSGGIGGAGSPGLPGSSGVSLVPTGFRVIALRLLNSFRTKSGALPLVLDQTLNRRAQAYAQKLASANVIRSSPLNFKQNIWSHRGELFTFAKNCEYAINNWYTESTIPGVKSIIDTTTLKSDIVSRVGLGVATNSDNFTVVVAFYL